MAEKPWEGRFSARTARSVEAFTSSIHFDRRLYAHDIAGSKAHARMLARAGVIREEEADLIIEGLSAIQEEIEAGIFAYDDSLEDIHMHIESRLFERVGPVAHKLHTARSRNDQVALDIRMYLRDVTLDLVDGLLELRGVIVDLAGAHPDVILPGYTHLQRAQPVLLAHHLLAYHEMFTRDAARLEDGFARINVLPLGSAALAGTTYPIDRHYTAQLLGFPAVAANSMDAVADRDFVLEFLAAAGILMVHLSRLSEELILWSTAEFGFIELPDAFATGSSIMPQKKNPDVPELVRGKAGRVFGDLMALLTLMKSLPLAYNRDMQEDKPPLFDAVDTVTACVRIFTEMLPHVKINTPAMRRATSKGFLDATDLADYLVTKGMPFRQAHGCVGRAVSHALSQKKELYELSLEELKGFADIIEADVFQALELKTIVDRRTSFGGTAGANVQQALRAARKALDGEAARQTARRRQLMPSGG